MRWRTSWMVSPCSVPEPQTVLNPLNSLGLWLPVIMTAPSALRCTAEKYSRGVGTTPISVTWQPESVRPSSNSSRRRGELRRQSRPSVMDLPLLRCNKVPRPRPRSTTSELNSSLSATPRISYSRKIVGLNIRRVLLKVALSAHESVPLDEEAQRPIGAMLNADARGNADLDFFRLLRRMNSQRTTREISSIVAAADPQGQSQLARAVGQVFDAARRGSAAPHPREAFQRLQGADQDASRAALRFGDHVQALVHTVDEVHVGVARLAEQHASAGSDAAKGVGRPILKAQVGFRFDDSARGDSAGRRPVHEDRAQQRSCDLDRRPIIERSRKRHWHAHLNLAYISTLPLNTMSLSLNFFLTTV